jgi:hypothetical protein
VVGTAPEQVLAAPDPVLLDLVTGGRRDFFLTHRRSAD